MIMGVNVQSAERSIGLKVDYNSVLYFTRNAEVSNACQKTLISSVLAVRVQHALWMADHRLRSRLDLTNLRS